MCIMHVCVMHMCVMHVCVMHMCVMHVCVVHMYLHIIQGRDTFPLRLSCRATRTPIHTYAIHA